MKRIFVCSPFRGNPEANLDFARICCEEVIALGYAPFAPHLFYPQFLDDDDPDQRALGLTLGLRWLRAADEVWVYKPPWQAELSEGMKEEINLATQLGKTIVRKVRPAANKSDEGLE